MKGSPVGRALGGVRGALTENLGYKLVALLTALLLWAWVQSEQVVQERVRVRIDWRLPEGLVLVEPPLPYATATVEGVQAYTRGVRQKELTLTVDLTEAREGEVNVDLTERPIEGMPDQVQVVSTTPGALQVQLDRVLRRRLPVRAVTHGEPAPGYALRDVDVTPDKVEVTGPASLLRRMSEITTDEVDLTAIKEDSEFPVALDLRKGRLTVPRGEDFVVKVRVEAVSKERRIEGVPVRGPEGGGWGPATPTVAVLLSGPADKVDALGPEEVWVRLSVPAEGVEEGAEARPGEGPGPRYEVVHPGGDAVVVRGVDPATLPLERR